MELPKNIQASLLTRIYPRYDKKRHTPRSIARVAKDAHNMEWTPLNKRVKEKLKLYPIFAYGNGDYAWYSFADGRVYDYSHDFDGFSGYLPPDQKKYQRQIHTPMKYELWERSILSGKHGSAIK